MSVDGESRRYLLGQDTDAERDALEQRYFADASMVDRIAAAEDTLVEDFVDGRLDAADRAAFERHYLASPEHRTRLAVVRRLRAAASASPATRSRSRTWTGSTALALAASALLAVAAAWYFAAGRGAPRPPDTRAAATAAATTHTPRTFAVALSPVAVRGDGATPAVVPPGTEVVALALGIDGEVPDTALQVVVTAVDGGEVWRGRATSERGSRTARADVPAANLPPNDYVVQLKTAEGDLARYALSIR